MTEENSHDGSSQTSNDNVWLIAEAAAKRQLSSPPGGSKQTWFQRHALQLFVFNFSILQLVQMMFAVYYIAVVRTIERRYGLTSTNSGIIMSVNDVVHISVVVFIGYIGRKSHKPIIIGSTAIFLFVSALLYASPYFIYGAEQFAASGGIANATSHSTTQQFCESDNVTDDCGSVENETKRTTSNSVFYILCVASALNGFGGSALNILGMAYVDQNADKNDSAFYLGVITSSFALGPILGIILGAICLRQPEDLQDSGMTPADPAWIGAWWLGYVISAVLLLVLTIPMFFFPKHIKPPTTDDKGNEKEASITDQIAGFPRALMKLFSNSAFVLMLVTGVLSVYVITGVFINMPRYFEIHYHMPAFKANLGAALPGLAGIFGGFVSGVIMKRYKFDLVDSTKMIMASLFVTSLGIASGMFITCPQIDLAGDWTADLTSVSVDQQCNSNCSCELSKNTYYPVCGDDGRTHYSPCYAGCSSGATINDTTYFSECSCMPGHGQSGACQEPCVTQFMTFAFTMLIMSFLSSLGRVPGAVLPLRVAGEDEGSFSLAIMSFVVNILGRFDYEGSFSLAIMSFVVNILGFIPGPIFFGSVIDSTCVLWQTACGKTGACLFYDTNRFRYNIFGFSLLFQAFSTVSCFGLLIAVKRRVARQKLLDEQNTLVVTASTHDEKCVLVEQISGV